MVGVIVIILILLVLAVIQFGRKKPETGTKRYYEEAEIIYHLPQAKLICHHCGRKHPLSAAGTKCRCGKIVE